MVLRQGAQYGAHLQVHGYTLPPGLGGIISLETLVPLSAGQTTVLSACIHLV